MTPEVPNVEPKRTVDYRRRTKRPGRRQRAKITIWIITGIFGVCLCWLAWLVSTALQIKSELSAAAALIPTLEVDVTSTQQGDAALTAERIRDRTSAAKDMADLPLWTLASAIPVLGNNFSAISEVSRSADDVASLGLIPLVKVYTSLNWDHLMPSNAGMDLGPLADASPTVSAASNAVKLSSNRLNQIDDSSLLPQIVEPLQATRSELREVSGKLDVAADMSRLAPPMLGGTASRNYLLMIQNNAESRASGGIPGALAVLTFNNGHMSLSAQSSAADVGVMTPSLSVDPQQEQIYSKRLGKYMQDVNLTPDFPTAAATAQAMWEKKTGQRVDGVMSIDPVVLGYILQSTGPVSVTGPEREAISAAGLPTELTGSNVVPTLLSDVYAKIQQPKLQDAYFAGVAKEVFSALSSGKGEAKGLIAGLTRGTEEGRVLVWSDDSTEQSVIAKYAVSGAVSGPSISPAQFGVYFNDGTGAKMDYYVKRTVQLVKECPVDGYEQLTVRVVSTNTAPADASSSLPAYVTGSGAFGVPPGSVQTNVVAYGPVQSDIESAKEDGQRTEFAAHQHANRPVGVISQRLAPGQSKTVEFSFGKIVQHTEPNVLVTPSIQPVKDVTLPTEISPCH
ncbi:DUF4012 domain-containing protein [Arthrobacter sp. NQ4]|uniref:DUF4012 domain-containing protein n=1 Tax=Arthrobacter sp. NQ4 TaxID=3027930 RepID=UPI0023B1B8A3|nr:DUF4012 domain-containing protein [Arthrobacter sp. NQ4]MDE8585930.1 DUF4012 domain-containing protein [Arthrobacter sp. NQ4]